VTAMMTRRDWRDSWSNGDKMERLLATLVVILKSWPHDAISTVEISNALAEYGYRFTNGRCVELCAYLRRVPLRESNGVWLVDVAELWDVTSRWADVPPAIRRKRFRPIAIANGGENGKEKTDESTGLNEEA